MANLLIYRNPAMEKDLKHLYKNSMSLMYKDITMIWEKDDEHLHYSFNESEEILLILLGDIYSLSHNSKIYEFATAKECMNTLMRKYSNDGVASLFNLNGTFVLLILDKIKEKLFLINDRYGYYPFYCYEGQNKQLTLSNNPNDLVEFSDGLHLNKKSISEFFSYGYLIDNKTMFKEIKKLKPATILDFLDNKEVTYWDFNNITEKKIDYIEAVDRLGYLWIKSVGRRIKRYNKFILPLSGGFDSRAILSAVDFLGQTSKIQEAFTWGHEECWEYLIAKELCKIANVKHRRIEVSFQKWTKGLETGIKNTMGSVISTAYFGGQWAVDYKNIPILDGLAGDLVLGGSFISSDNQNVNQFFYSTMADFGINNKDCFNTFEWDKIESDMMTQKWVEYFALRNSRVPGFTLNGSISQGGDIFSIFPFFDNDLIDFIYSIPLEWRKSEKIYKDMLIKFFPKYYIDIPNNHDKKAIKNIGLRNSLNLEDKYRFHVLKTKPCIIFGASTYGQKILRKLDQYINVIYFTDNDCKKWGEKIEGIEVIPPESLIKLKDEFNIIICSMYHNEIEKQLIEMGIENYYTNNIYINENKTYSISFKQWFENKDNFKWLKKSIFNSDFYKILDYNNNEIMRELKKLNKKVDYCYFQNIILIITFNKFYEIYKNHIIR